MTVAAESLIYQPPNWVDRLDWQVVFGNARPVEIDLGCGRGTFLIQTAAAQAERNFLGVDRLLGRLRRLGGKAHRRGLANLRLLRIEAGYFVGYLAPVNSIAVYHVYFPDPWPKRRHQRRRLFNVEFVRRLHQTLVPAGELHVATDHEGYFLAIREAVAGAGDFREFALPATTLGVATDFEQKFSAAGRAIYRSAWCKVEGPVTTSVSEVNALVCNVFSVGDNGGRGPTA